MTNADDPFADLEADLEDEPADLQATTQSDSLGGSQRDHHSLDRSSQDVSEPAFSFDSTKQDALYARPTTWDIFDDTLLETELALRDQRVRDVPKRELHDAALRVLTNHKDELVDAVVVARRESMR